MEKTSSPKNSMGISTNRKKKPGKAKNGVEYWAGTGHEDDDDDQNINYDRFRWILLQSEFILTHSTLEIVAVNYPSDLILFGEGQDTEKSSLRFS
jgi:hypothetical protein